MSSIRGMIERALKCPNKLEFCARDRKIAFYSLLAASTIVCIMALLTMAYAGSYNPLDLFRYDNFTFSYSGSPLYTKITSQECYVGLSGVNGSVTTLSLPGESKLTLYPTGDIEATASNNTTWQIPGREARTIALMPGEEGNIAIAVSREDAFNYNMRLNYNNTSWVPHGWNDSSQDVLKIVNKGKDQYIVNATCFPGAVKWFEIKRDQPWNFLVTVSRKRINGSGWGADLDNARSLTYYGQINVSTNDELWLIAPISAMSPAESRRLVLEHAEGDLDIEHITHKCNPADNIDIHPVNSLNVTLNNGHVLAYGYANFLDFRQRNFGRPITVIMKEGNFALLTGLLSSFLTIILARLVKTIRKK